MLGNSTLKLYLNEYFSVSVWDFRPERNGRTGDCLISDKQAKSKASLLRNNDFIN